MTESLISFFNIIWKSIHFLPVKVSRKLSRPGRSYVNTSRALVSVVSTCDSRWGSPSGLRLLMSRPTISMGLRRELCSRSWPYVSAAVAEAARCDVTLSGSGLAAVDCDERLSVTPNSYSVTLMRCPAGTCCLSKQAKNTIVVIVSKMRKQG